MPENPAPLSRLDRARTWWEQHRQWRQSVFWSAVWLIYLLDPLRDLLGGDRGPGEVLLGLLALAALVGVYLRVVWLALAAFRAPSRPLAHVGALGLLALILTLAYGESWMVLFVYVSAAAAVSFPVERAAVGVAGVTALVFGTALATGDGGGAAALLALQVAIIGGALLLLRRILTLVSDLSQARDEVARLAIDRERLRFARDLHDLLGHSLSLIVLKSELAGRIVDHDTAVAGNELRDIESVARQSLAEVRDAVRGYRQRGLVSELHDVRETLAGAGIHASIHAAGAADLPEEIQSLLGWVVREGVTNVMRHSGADRCEIIVARNDTNVSLEICDNGAGRQDDNAQGSGLRGLAERLADAGGRLEACSQVAGGFVLAARLPVEAPARDCAPWAGASRLDVARS